jgi:hypothetical protein
MVREQLVARSEEYALDPAPEIPPPPDFGVGDAVALEVKGAGKGTERDLRGGQMITVIVQFGLPQPITRDRAREIFSSSAPRYRMVPGLLRKYYILSTDGGTAGGVYLWRSREHADRFYTDEWKEGIREKYGALPSVTHFECPVVVDNVVHETIIDA